MEQVTGGGISQRRIRDLENYLSHAQ